MFKTITTALVLAGTVATAGAASAQSWGYDRDYGRGYGRSWQDQRQIDRYLVESTCSGQRGQALEARLWREYREGDISRADAQRIQYSIDRLQDKERHECRERDFREARDIGKRYIQLRARIDDLASRRGYGWNNGYRGNYGYNGRGW
jgi:hypothetical protein